MVVYEIKKTTPPPSEPPKQIRRDLAPVEKVTPATPVDQLLKRWRRNKGQQGRQQRRPSVLSPSAERDVRATISKVNANLARQSLPIHLVLIAAGDGYVIDVYDCQVHDNACQVIGDLIIDLDDLPILLRNLTQEAGIIIDTVS